MRSNRIAELIHGYKSKQIEKNGSYPWSREILWSKRLALQMGLLALVLIYSYMPVFRALATTWWSRDDYSHGFLIPLISLYLVWFRREMLRPLQVQPAYLGGILVMSLAGAMFIAGEAGGLITLQELSLVLMIAGIVLSFLGKDYLRVMGFPITYLIFMVPIADEIVEPLHWSFQLLTAKMGVAFLQALGFTAFVEHQYILLPSITLEVAHACSGINYLISIIAIGIPLAYVTQKNIWCRVSLVFSAVIIGIMGNWIRVAAIGIWAHYGGEVLHGPFHVFQALFVAQLGFVALFAGAWWLSKIPVPHSKRVISRPLMSQQEKGNLKNQDRALDRSWMGAFLILLGLTVYFSFYERTPVPLKAEFESFPISTGDWRGQIGDPKRVLFRVQGADDELVRIYRSPSGRKIELYVAYFESQHHSKELVNYLTAPLHHNATLEDIPIGQRNSIRVNRNLIHTGRDERYVFFWYDLNGQIVADQNQAKFVTILDALIHRRTNGAFVLVSGTVPDQENGKTIIVEERALIRDLVPVIRRYLPS